MIYVFLVLLAAIVAWRIILPGMRLEPRAGAGAAGVAPAAPAAAAYRWISATRVTNIALIVAGVVVFSVGVYNPTWSNPHPATIGSWGRGHWFTLVILWGIGAALIWLNASERAAKTLQTVLAGAVAAVLIVFPLWGWTTSPLASAPRGVVTTSICPNVSAEETRKCVVTSDWSSWIQFANGSRDNGKHMCASLGVQSERRDEHGVTFWRFRVAGDGTQEVKYKLLPANADCSGNVL